ncbi:MAG: hypothetical protein ACD_30C00026G0003 [uncultured bacterium]|uniref:DUF4352 domain-containing protein n=4 Tax=Candidatus Daviesiibacteriota TaxID=1752718 RepID=A0A0G0I2D2_9BACT|nr:MAG: hypothetical protein ACD_30C00026G0003 [uncultured bacterium]KKQ10261.1 MAG: hypothetical protein US19_C0007G0006 [Candidatus Daviesbacteria bacterium GW2011_GWB1_36_5]KKQ16360.1 MAG: hypothetical protein US28_C0002G0027 [Candidatus Daviesbacteria bacterium GW2011_GWA1_36_8]OGE16376.1 MAG: hypothetical protein A2858_04200 [Candidatus Daviesbacteria bacterium RIFCSPHIGHO2_01_FULL_36_37]OGE35649.1 MAG: hypothetical protein A3E66_04340 [Candidatus Daviesbacteria bacterium RIFCSPHIGHO2_12_F
MNRFSNLRLNRYSSRLPEKNKLILYAFLGIVVLGALFWGGSVISGFNKGGTLGDSRFELPDAKSTAALNHEFQFPIKNNKGEEVSKLKYIIENAEIRDQIVVKGKRATSVKGRTFFVLNLKIVNDFNKPIEINTRDYIRLSVNGNDAEWLAADVHNDPVAIQPISTKYTRLAFPINDSDSNFRIQVGEIKGEKQIVEVKF